MKNTNPDILSIEPDVPAEEYLATLMVTDKDARELIADAVTPEMFASQPANRIIKAVTSLMAEQVEVDDASLVDRLREQNEKSDPYDRNSQPEFIVALVRQTATTTENAAHFVARLKENFDRRSLLNVLQRSQAELVSKPEDYLRFRAKLEEEILLDRVSSTVKPVTIWDTLDAIKQAKKSGGIGYSWGMGKKLDELTGGIVPGRYYVVGGLKKTGKTRFGLSVISDLVGNRIVEKRIPCLIISLEMSADQVNRILLSRQAVVDSRLLGTRYLSRSHLDQLDIAAKCIEDWPMYVIDSPGMTIEQITGAIRRYSRRGVKVVLLDYLQRIDIPNRGDSRATAMQKAVNQLADATRKCNVALIALSQLANRAELGNEPSVGDFKESGGIAEACDCAIILHNHDRSASDKTRLFDIGISVQRFGPSGMKVVVKHDLCVSRFYPDRESPEENYCEKCGHSVPLESREVHQ